MFCLSVGHVIKNLFQKIFFQIKWKRLNAACESIFLDHDDLNCGHPVESVFVFVYAFARVSIYWHKNCKVLYILQWQLTKLLITELILIKGCV